MSQIVGEMILFRPWVKVYTFAARHEELQYCKGSDVMLDDFYLLFCTERVSIAVSSCFQARLTVIAQLWNSLKPPFVAFRYSEDLYRRELTGRVMLRVPGGGLAVCGIVGDPFPRAWSGPLTSIMLPSQWMSGAIPPLSHLPFMSCT